MQNCYQPLYPKHGVTEFEEKNKSTFFLIDSRSIILFSSSIDRSLQGRVWPRSQSPFSNTNFLESYYPAKKAVRCLYHRLNTVIRGEFFKFIPTDLKALEDDAVESFIAR